MASVARDGCTADESSDAPRGAFSAAFRRERVDVAETSRIAVAARISGFLMRG